MVAVNCNFSNAYVRILYVEEANINQCFHDIHQSVSLFMISSVGISTCALDVHTNVMEPLIEKYAQGRLLVWVHA